MRDEYPINKFRGSSTICVQEFSSQHLSSQHLFWSSMIPHKPCVTARIFWEWGIGNGELGMGRSFSVCLV